MAQENAARASWQQIKSQLDDIITRLQRFNDYHNFQSENKLFNLDQLQNMIRQLESVSINYRLDRQMLAVMERFFTEKQHLERQILETWIRKIVSTFESQEEPMEEV